MILRIVILTIILILPFVREFVSDEIWINSRPTEFQIEFEDGGAEKKLLFGQKIDINEASARDLTALTGIGPKTAQKIVNFRLQNGRFMAIEDIQSVRGIGPKKFAAIRDQIDVK